jgi:hypothetical protein
MVSRGEGTIIPPVYRLPMNFACPRIGIVSESQPFPGLPFGGTRAQVCSLHPQCGSRTGVSAHLERGAGKTETQAEEEDLLATANCPNGLSWFVAHTRPRCEKKFVQNCARDGLQTTLPCYRSVHRYRGKTVAFDKPLFPGYAFLFMELGRRQYVFQNQHVANLLEVFEQALFVRQLEDVMRALAAEVEIRLAPQIGPGRSVRIKGGPPVRVGGLGGGTLRHERRAAATRFHRAGRRRQSARRRVGIDLTAATP